MESQYIHTQSNSNQPKSKDKGRSSYRTVPHTTLPYLPTLRSPPHTYLCGGKSMKPCEWVPDEEGGGKCLSCSSNVETRNCLGVCGAGGTKVPSFGFGVVWCGLVWFGWGKKGRKSCMRLAGLLERESTMRWWSNHNTMDNRERDVFGWLLWLLRVYINVYGRYSPG